MVPVIRIRRWWRTAAGSARAASVHPRALALLGGSLALVAVSEAFIRAGINGADPELALAFGLLALGTTLPLAVVGRLGAASICCATSVLSLAAFHTLTAAGFTVLLITLYRLARGEQQHALAQLTAVALGVPFVVLVFTGAPPTSSEASVLTVLLAALAPVSSLRGISLNAPPHAPTTP